MRKPKLMFQYDLPCIFSRIISCFLLTLKNYNSKDTKTLFFKIKVLLFSKMIMSKEYEVRVPVISGHRVTRIANK